MAGYIDTANELTKGLNTLFANLTLGKFVKWIFVIITVLAISLFLYENLTSSSFYYDRLERKLQVIEKVKSINSNDSLVNKIINKRLLETLNELNPPKKNYFESISLSLGFTFESLWTIFLKVFGASILPILIILYSRGDLNRKNTITGSIIFIIVFGVIAVFIPVLYSIWINVIAMPFLQVLVLLPFMLASKKK